MLTLHLSERTGDSQNGNTTAGLLPRGKAERPARKRRPGNARQTLAVALPDYLIKQDLLEIPPGAPDPEMRPEVRLRWLGNRGYGKVRLKFTLFLGRLQPQVTHHDLAAIVCSDALFAVRQLRVLFRREVGEELGGRQQSAEAKYLTAENTETRLPLNTILLCRRQYTFSLMWLFAANIPD